MIGGVGVEILSKKLFTNVPQMYKCKQKIVFGEGGGWIGWVDTKFWWCFQFLNL